VFTFADSDESNVEVHGTPTPLGTNPTFFSLAGEVIVTVGTGRFANAA
jgi:hypothetical protein